jgi:hypothetical protein
MKPTLEDGNDHFRPASYRAVPGLPGMEMTDLTNRKRDLLGPLQIRSNWSFLFFLARLAAFSYGFFVL